MDIWENWSSSLENESLFNEVCSKLKSQKTLLSTVWQDLHNYESTPGNNFCEPMETDSVEFGAEDKEKVVDLIKESLETQTALSECIFSQVPNNCLFDIFQLAAPILKSTTFSFICDMLESWNSDILVEQALKAIVFPKLQKNNESSSCVIFSLTKLAKKHPNSICENVLIPLMTSKSIHFTDVELLKNIFSALPAPQRDAVILTFTKKNNIREMDWLLIQPLVKMLSPNSIVNMINFIYDQCSVFEKSQVFGRFLVEFSKMPEFFGKKDLLLEAVNRHKTLLKRQALKYLNQT